MKECSEYAYAKINLTLEVLGKREDGYHELRSIFMPLEFHDFVQIRIQEGTQQIQLISKYPRLNTKFNLMYQAAELFLKQYNLMYDVEIEYVKSIPSQAGLGGGSADAAAVIRGLVKLFDISLSESEAIQLCSQIGADVPFCYINKPALVEGIGDKIAVFENNCAPYVVLIKPKKGASTKQIFKNLTTYANPNENYSEQMKQALAANDYETIQKTLVNDLEHPACVLVPEIAKVKNELLEEGIRACVMSGSGSTVVCLVTSATLARRIVKNYKNRGYFSVCTNFLKEKS